MFTQLCKMLVMATFFPDTDNAPETVGFMNVNRFLIRS